VPSKSHILRLSIREVCVVQQPSTHSLYSVCGGWPVIVSSQQDDSSIFVLELVMIVSSQLWHLCHSPGAFRVVAVARWR
jgi:hypothetical protein